jgi:hypothetical protein
MSIFQKETRQAKALSIGLLSFFRVEKLEHLLFE